MTETYLFDFIKESNGIERIQEVRDGEVEALRSFLDLKVLTITDVCNLVNIFQPGARVRDEHGMNVHIGEHSPPPGNRYIREMLKKSLEVIEIYTPYHWHVNYETLHPFMDGNGRSGRAIWLWHMIKKDDGLYRLGFLHAWYYQTLDAARNTEKL